MSAVDAHAELSSRVRAAARWLAWRRGIESALCALAAGLLAAAALLVDTRGAALAHGGIAPAARGSAQFALLSPASRDRATDARVSTRSDAAATSDAWCVALCAGLAAFIAWRELRASRARALSWWDHRLELDGALITASEHASDDDATPVARALVARVADVLPHARESWRYVPAPLPALALALLGAGLWAAVANARPVVTRGASPRALDAFARGTNTQPDASSSAIDGVDSRTEDAPAPAGADDVARPDAVRHEARASSSEASREPENTAAASVVAREREPSTAELTSTRASSSMGDPSRADRSAASSSALAPARAGAAGREPSVARASAPRLPLSPAEVALTSEWIERRRQRLRGANE